MQRQSDSLKANLCQAQQRDLKTITPLSHRLTVLTNTIDYRTIGFLHYSPNPNYKWNKTTPLMVTWRSLNKSIHLNLPLAAVRVTKQRMWNRAKCVYKHSTGCQTCLTTGLTTGCIVHTAGCHTGCTTRLDNRLNEQWLFVQLLQCVIIYSMKPAQNSKQILN